MKHILLTSLLFVLAACGQTTPHDKLVEALKTTRSWTATAQMVGEAWQQGSVPDQYAQQTLTKSQQEIDKVTKEFSPPPPLFQQVQQTIQEMNISVKQQNKAAIANSLQSIFVEQQQLNALAKAEEAQP